MVFGKTLIRPYIFIFRIEFLCPTFKIDEKAGDSEAGPVGIRNRFVT